MIDAVFDRGDQPELIESDRPQTRDHVANGAVHMVDGTNDRFGRLVESAAIASAAVADRYSVELDRIQVLPELIVQLAREVLALGLLDAQVLLRELAVLGERFGSRASAIRRALSSRRACW